MTDTPTVAVISISGVILTGRGGTRERERDREIDNDVYVHVLYTVVWKQRVMPDIVR